MPGINFSKELFYRDCEIEERAIDIEKRSVDLSFSSEAPLQRWFGTEILSHAAGAVEIARAQSLLFNHNSSRIIGPVSNKKVDGGKGYARGHFDETEEGELALTRVKSRSLRGTSVGYQVYKYKKLEPGEEFELADGRKIKGGNENNPTYVAIRWAPIEISLTPIPADSTVGVGRAATRSLDGIEIEQTIKPNKEEEIEMEKKELDQAVADALKNRDEKQQQRLKGIYDRAAVVGLEGMAFKLITDGKTEDEINDALFAEIAKQRGAPKDAGEGDPDTKNTELSSVDDDVLARSMAEPVLIDLD